ncbi:MAG: glycosyltransferase [Heliobacteriaceae bacterium]|nr:glycosyltransferase [Heliobacteriaceae bacterium]MDD4587584.1 glycosyltransferase [Heliobacteriaceae bacterium]
MRKPRLSLCLIAKNEAANLPRCLNSVKKLADEIILVDTGSTDATIAVARAWGANVLTEPWENDFSKPRNKALAQATGDWILVLDCDEELDPESKAAVRTAIANNTYEAYLVSIVNPVVQGAEIVAATIRLFRNQPCLRFQGRIHEQISAALINNFGPQAIGHSDIRIIHHGYNPSTANIPAKIQRNLNILLRYPEAEKDGFYFYNLGTEYLRLGEKEKALTCFQQSLPLTKPTQGYAPSLVKKTIATLLALNQYREAIRQLQHYQAIYPEFTDLHYLEALCHLHCGRYSNAKACLGKYLALPPTPPAFPRETPDPANDPAVLRNRIRRLAIRPPDPPLSICLTGRDEAPHIARCLRSINEIGREIIFVDTGSTDNTPVIARQMGAKVFSLPATVNLTTARNYALDQATGDWVLVLNADEALADETRQTLTTLLDRPGPAGYQLKIQHFLAAGLSPGDSLCLGSCRLFRRRSYRFQGTVFPDITPAIRTTGETVLPVEITIHRFACLAPPEYRAGKQEANLKALHQAADTDPLTRNLALGLACYLTGDNQGACRYLARNMPYLEQLLINTPPLPAAVAWYCQLFALALFHTGKYRQLMTLLNTACPYFPDCTGLVYLKARVYSRLGRHAQAETLFRQCLAQGDSPWEHHLVTPGEGTFRPLTALAGIHAHRNEAEKALALLQQAAQIPGGFDEAVTGLALWHAELGAPPDQLLAAHGWLNSRSLSIAAEILAKTNHYEASLRCLTLAGETITKEPPPRDFRPLVQAGNDLLTRFSRQAAKFLPGNIDLRRLLS